MTIPALGKRGESSENRTEQDLRSTIPAATDETCWLCRNGEPDNRWGLCQRCLAALFRQLRRRREAAARMAPLADGRRDPAGPVTDGRWAA